MSYLIDSTKLDNIELTELKSIITTFIEECNNNFNDMFNIYKNYGIKNENILKGIITFMTTVLKKYDEALNLEDGEGFNDSEDVDDLEEDQEDEEPTKKTMAKLSG